MDEELKNSIVAILEKRFGCCDAREISTQILALVREYDYLVKNDKAKTDDTLKAELASLKREYVQTRRVAIWESETNRENFVSIANLRTELKNCQEKCDSLDAELSVQRGINSRADYALKNSQKLLAAVTKERDEAGDERKRAETALTALREKIK